MTQNKKMTNDSGRSMVEMLGVLAVIGVLSIAGVAGYTNAMNKHRANEILNGASVRAVVVSTQLQKNKDATPTLAEFGEEAVQGVSYSVEKFGDDKFKIKLSGDGLTTKVSEQIKNIVGTEGVIRQVGTNASFLVYNNDLSTAEIASDYSGLNDTGTACTQKGYKHCSGSDSCIPTGSDCTCSTEPSECQKCDTATGSLAVDEGKACGNNSHKSCNASGNCVWDLNKMVKLSTNGPDICGCTLIGRTKADQIKEDGYIDYDHNIYHGYTCVENLGIGYGDTLGFLRFEETGEWCWGVRCGNIGPLVCICDPDA